MPIHTSNGSQSASVEYQEEFELVLGSVMFSAFAGAFFDQVMLPEVAAGVEWTGRIRTNPFDRALRSAAGEQLIFAGSEADRKAEGEWLLKAHRDVKGVGYDGKRFSALKPENWNWIMMSAIWAYQQYYCVLAGGQLSQSKRDEFYRYLLARFEHLQLRARTDRLPATYQEFLDRYDSLINEKGETNRAVQGAVTMLLRAPRPPILPAVTQPLWVVPSRIVGHVVAVCSFGIMHPKARELTGFNWKALHDIEFHAIASIIATYHARAPRRLTLTPLAYHRWRAQTLADRYRRARRPYFAPDGAA
jgi:uncharacterized protein (DUF2236 family)